MPNALIHEKSPYLRQHAENPVDWLPWGEAAFTRARTEDKPIFLSIGYSTCHWCHVMAHESFEDETTAQWLNQFFVPVKIDREERPDVDRVYMLFVQASTGSGGWPMSVWLTPELKPFYGGTYFPPDNRYGRPGFQTILQHLATAWRDDRSRILESSIGVTEQLRSLASGTSRQSTSAGTELFDAAFWQFRRSFDSQYGGFGAAPKFPRPATLLFLLRYAVERKSPEALEMTTHTLRAMAAGGMHDHLGGGFHRYSVDERWFVPHFEKMLYDQAQLAIAYLEAGQATGDPYYAEIVHDILGYLLRDMADPQGGFYSAEDADSTDPEDPGKHGEGAFYIWRESEIRGLLTPDAASELISKFHVRAEGNVEADPHGEFSGRNILYRDPSETPVNDSPRLKDARDVLFSTREKRPRPQRDDKVLTAWNALTISAFARAGAVLGDLRYLHAARRAAEFVRLNLYSPETGSLLRRFCRGDAAIPAFADDYAFLAQALTDLFEVTGSPAYLSWAVDLCERGLLPFFDQAEGGLFSTAIEAPDVILRLKDEYDGAEPSANAVAADVLQRLAHLTGKASLKRMADMMVGWLSKRVQSQPVSAPQALCALLRAQSSGDQTVYRVAETNPETAHYLQSDLKEFIPYRAVLLLPDAAINDLTTSAPFLASLQRHGMATRYRCQNFTCQVPEVLG